MAATTAGPSSNTAELFLGNPPTCGVEVQVPAGLPSLGPASASFVDPQTGTTLTAANAVNKTTVGVLFVSPA